MSEGVSFRPGSWYAVLGEHALVLLPEGERSRVAGLWELVDSGAGFDEVLDALVAGGLAGLPGFVLASRATDPARVLVRGAARATLSGAEGGREVVAGREDRLWSEARVAGLCRLEVALDQPAAQQVTDGRLTEPGRAEAGVLRVGSLSWPAVPLTAPEPAPAPEEAPETTAWVRPVPGAPVTPTAAPAPEPAPAAPVVPTAAPAPEPAPAAPVVPTAAPTPPAVDHDGHTVVGSVDPARFAGASAGIAGQPEVPRVTAQPVARLHFSHGEEIAVDRVVLIGRAPEARRFSAADRPRLVTVPSPLQEISSTHLEVRPGSGADLGSAVVTDLGSTNGTTLTLPGLAAEELQPGIAVQLLPGSRIDLGDGLSISVDRA